ncbi:MMPL family transporter [Nocardioidaceae bacterium SCSIO 66511]|nr:MMPL family transporter [Nocardioidaceae bacterium SCSIO 66511]
MSTQRGRFVRLAAWSQRHHWWALAMWAIALVAVTAASVSIGNDYRDENTLPGTESQAVADALESQNPRESADTVQIVMHADDGLASSQIRPRVTTMLADVDALTQVSEVSDPYTADGAVSPDGTIAFADVRLDTEPSETDPTDVRTIIDTAQEADGDGLQVELGGDAVRNASESGGAAEGLGILAALIILIPLFGSLLAGSLPVIVAIFAVGTSVGIIALASQAATIPSYAAPMMMLVGLGVGIDYALLVFSRYRSELLHGFTRAAAARTALDTAGRSVLFAGCTVIVALLGLLLIGMGAIQGLALAVALTVLMTMVASITLLPALLTLFGRRIEKSVRKRAAKSKRAPGSGWRSLAAAVQRRPVAALVVSVAGLIALALPALDMRLGFADAGTDAPDSTSRQAYDLLADGFGDGANGPLIVLAEADQRAAGAAAETLRTTDGVERVAGPIPTDEQGASTLLVFPDSGPADQATTDLVHTLRDDVLPRVSDDAGGTYRIGGSTPAAIDFADAVGERLPWFIAAVVAVSAVLLTAVFRSVLIPLKAAALNLLSIGAALGVMTYVFGDGHFGAQPGPIEAYLPVIMFAVVFGLSMDYEVFLVSRMHEEWRRTRDAVHSVREGLAATGGVITAAAAIMIVVFGAFIASPSRMLQQMGLGLAVVVLLDALVIRCLIVPAVMRLLGRSAWWLPRWLDRALPTVELENPERVEPPAPERVPAG